MTMNHSKPSTPWEPTPHHGVGQGRPGQQEEAEEGHDPAVEGAAEQVAKRKSANSARRGEISAKRTTKQPMGDLIAAAGRGSLPGGYLGLAVSYR